MAGELAFVKAFRYKPKVIKTTKEEDKEAEARAKLFYSSVDRFKLYAAGITADHRVPISGVEANEIIISVTRGPRFVKRALLSDALEKIRNIHSDETTGSVVDQRSKLTKSDVWMLLSAGNQALGAANRRAKDHQGKQITSAIGLVLAFMGIMALMATVVFG